MTLLTLDAIQFHEDCQARVRLDQGSVADYANALGDGAAFPAIVVFFDGSTYWLADGFHRWSAHRMAGVEQIECEVRQGGQTDAIKYALKANALHGKRREPGDYAKGYDIAVRNGLCAAHDSAAVRDILACSERWARDLTAPARDRIERERNARIVEAREAGETVRQVAVREGVDPGTVSRVAQRHSAELQQGPQPATEPPPVTPPAQDHVRTVLASLNPPDSMAWSSMMTQIEDATAAIHEALKHDCPPVMARKAKRVLGGLRGALAKMYRASRAKNWGV